MENINYYLIEASKVRLGGYGTMNRQFYFNLADAIYEGNKHGYRVMRFIENKVPWVNSPNAKIPVCYPFIYSSDLSLIQDKKLATADTSCFVADVYRKMPLLPTYRELAFTMFILRLVNPYDYLKHERDVGFVVERFIVDRVGYSQPVDGLLRLTPVGYSKLMLAYIRNASEGVDYGVCAWDFVYHILKKMSKYKLDSVYRTISSSLSEGNLMGDYNVLGITPEILKKYTEEIIVTSPILCRLGYMGEEDLLNLLLYIQKDKTKCQYIQFLLRDEAVFCVGNTRGIEYSWDFV